MDGSAVNGLQRQSRISENVELSFFQMNVRSPLATAAWIVFVAVMFIGWAMFLVFLIVILSIAPESLTLPVQGLES